MSGDLLSYINFAVSILNDLMSVLMAVAVIAFVANIIRYFIVQSSDVTGRANARRYLLYSILGLVCIVGMWGIVNIALYVLAINNATTPHQIDYIEINTADD